jgi:hypothetical protein
MVVRDSNLVGNIPIKENSKDLTLCQLYIIFHGLFLSSKTMKNISLKKGPYQVKKKSILSYICAYTCAK